MPAAGFSPREYLIQLRIQKAKSLLSTTDLPVNKIAHTAYDNNHSGNSDNIDVAVEPYGAEELEVQELEDLND